MVKKVLILGGGFAGCAVAMMLAGRSGYEVTLLDSGGNLGAGVRTFFRGGHPYTFGPRHFLTQNQKAFDYLNAIVPMRLCAEHEFRTYIEDDEKFYSYPIHYDDIAGMPDAGKIYNEIEHCNSVAQKSKTLEQYWVQSVGVTLYNKFINSYSKKMWDVANNNEIDDFGWSPKGVALKKGPRAAWDTAISAYPVAIDGYNRFFELVAERIDNLLFHHSVQRADYDQRIVYTDKGSHSYDILVSTISPDIIAEYRYGELPYMGRDIETIVLPVEFALPQNVYFCYYAGKEKYTRVTEYKKFYKYQSSSTLISIEYPSKNGRHYPMPFEIEYSRANKYFFDMPDNVFSIGRAGSYRYSVDIDDCLLQAMDVVEKLG